MKSWDAVVTFYSGSGLDTLAVNSSTPSTPDGTEYIAELINNGMFGWMQDFMDYASLTPSGVIEIKGTSQLRTAIQLGNGVGPGKYVQWGLADNPSVTGDRVLLLSEQGVLIASYPDLDAACWIGGDTAAQVAAAAAGAKFYRSSDAAGTTGDAAGPYLQLPAANPTFLQQYDDSVVTVTGQTGFSINAGTFLPYKTSDGTWYLLFHVDYTQNSSTVADISISGITTPATPNQACSGSQRNTSSTSTTRCYLLNGTTSVRLEVTVASTNFTMSGNIRLASKPTWADDFSFPWGITY
jgi:hypothetical protein